MACNLYKNSSSIRTPYIRSENFQRKRSRAPDCTESTLLASDASCRTRICFLPLFLPYPTRQQHMRQYEAGTRKPLLPELTTNESSRLETRRSRRTMRSTPYRVWDRRYWRCSVHLFKGLREGNRVPNGLY